MNEHDTLQDAIFKAAINRALVDIGQLPDGDLRLKIVQMVYFDKTHTIDGAAEKVYTSTRTVQRWLSNFICTVGKYAGFR